MAGNIIPCLMFEYYKAFDSFNKCDGISRLLSRRDLDVDIIIITNQWWIQDFPEVGVPTLGGGASIPFFQIFPKFV